MIYPETTRILKNGALCTLRSPGPSDAAAMLEHLKLTSGETDNMIRYPEEIRMKDEQEAEFLTRFLEDPKSLMVGAFVDGVLAGAASFSPVAPPVEKCRHRAEFGISVKERFWGIGVGAALLEANVAQARSAGFTQLELDVVKENHRAIRLYRRFGFRTYGERPGSFRLRSGEYQTLVLMLLPLEPGRGHS